MNCYSKLSYSWECSKRSSSFQYQSNTNRLEWRMDVFRQEQSLLPQNGTATMGQVVPGFTLLSAVVTEGRGRRGTILHISGSWLTSLHLWKFWLSPRRAVLMPTNGSRDIIWLTDLMGSILYRTCAERYGIRIFVPFKSLYLKVIDLYVTRVTKDEG